VLVNLAANARDAMPGGGSIWLLVAVSRRAARGHGAPWLSITVSDDGCGMDDATRRRAGEPFFTTKSAGRGSGLGLSLAEAFARRHGGRLAMESAPGRGTAVTISLPAQCTACTPAAGDHVAPSRLRD
jgi:signal transduction histidine kinase